MLLRTIDSLWVEHLTELDDMRRGIGLRGYAQQDPLNEFRKEAFRLYEELCGPHPPPGRDDDLPGHGQARAGDGAAPRPRPAGPRGQEHTHADGSVHPGPAHDEAPGSGTSSTGTGVAGGAVGFGGGSATGAGGARRGRRRDRHAWRGPDRGLARGSRCGPRARSPGDAAAAGGARQGFTPSGARIGRNDPCWCGSGQKYKKCHGA